MRNEVWSHNLKKYITYTACSVHNDVRYDFPLIPKHIATGPNLHEKYLSVDFINKDF